MEPVLLDAPASGFLAGREGGRAPARGAPDLRRDRQRLPLGRRRRAGALRRRARPRHVRQGHGQWAAARRRRRPRASSCASSRTCSCRAPSAATRWRSRRARDARRLPRASPSSSISGAWAGAFRTASRRSPRGSACPRAAIGYPVHPKVVIDHRSPESAAAADEPVPPGDRGARGDLPLRGLQRLLLPHRGRRRRDARRLRATRSA